MERKTTTKFVCFSPLLPPPPPLFHTLSLCLSSTRLNSTQRNLSMRDDLHSQKTYRRTIKIKHTQCPCPPKAPRNENIHSIHSMHSTFGRMKKQKKQKLFANWWHECIAGYEFHEFKFSIRCHAAALDRQLLFYFSLHSFDVYLYFRRTQSVIRIWLHKQLTWHFSEWTLITRK